MKKSTPYNSRWNTARRGFLARHPLCVMCRQQGRTVAATVVDHIIPHRLGEALLTGNDTQIAHARKLFWDSDNWQPLCKQHHDATKQRIEKRGHRIGCDSDGMPLDIGARWYQKK